MDCVPHPRGASHPKICSSECGFSLDPFQTLKSALNENLTIPEYRCAFMDPKGHTKMVLPIGFNTFQGEAVNKAKFI
jgi:hypothetical protein